VSRSSLPSASPSAGTAAAPAARRSATTAVAAVAVADGSGRLAPAPAAESSSDPPQARVPLVVDLDGTLLSSDLVAESLAIFAKEHPFRLPRLLLWLGRGRASLKRQLALEAKPDSRTLPYNRSVLAFLESERRGGRSLILATGADELVAGEVAAELGLFDAVCASDGVTNLTGERKRDRLVAEFGVGGFDYVGDGNQDQAVFAAARNVILVGRADDPEHRAAARIPVPDQGRGRAWWQSLRAHHWTKNLLVFLPLLFARRLFELGPLAHAVAGFAVFSLCASSIYLLNDLTDLQHDRRHPHKKDRPLASGRFPLSYAAAAIPLLLVAAVAIGLTQPPALLGVVGVYYLLMVAYCLKLRQLIVVDVATLAAGYGLRVMGGAAAGGLPVSVDLLVACVAFFFSLALLKRYAELVTMRSIGADQAHGRGYFVRHSRALVAVGCGSGYLAIGILASALSLDHRPGGRGALIGLVLALLLYWVTRMWLMARGGRIVDDPVAFALTDRPSQIIAALAATIALLVM